MIVNRECQVIAGDFVTSQTHGEIEIYWIGLVYIPGFRSGASTVTEIAGIYERTGKVPFERLRGSFSMVLRTPSHVLAFADNSDMGTIFINENAIGTEFLSLLEHLRDSDNPGLSLSERAAAQAYSIGRILSERTLIDSVTMLDKQRYAEIRGGIVEIRDKGVLGIDARDPRFDPGEFFDALAFALTPMHTSCALTGGYDSRMVYTFLINRMEVQPSLSGNVPAMSDVRVGRAVATSMGQRLNFVETRRPAIDEEAVVRSFYLHDGATGFSADSSFRLSAYYARLRAQGFDVHVTGDGGVLHKDWEWIQDFPLYRKKRTNLDRFYRQRLAFNFDDRGAGDRIRPELTGMKEQVISVLTKHVQGTNTQTYDMLYYHVNGRRTAYYSNSRHGIRLYAPLLERDFVAYSYALPRRTRFFNNNLRLLTTRENRHVAAIPTVYGTTASSMRRHMFRDLFYQLRDYGKRGVRMVGRKFLGRTPMLEQVVSWTVDDALRALPLTESAVLYCQEQGIIRFGESIGSLSRQHLDCALQIYLTAQAAGLLVSPSGKSVSITQTDWDGA